MTPRPLTLILALLLALPAGAIDFPDPEDLESAEQAKGLEEPEGLPESVERDLEAIRKIDDQLQEKVEKINADADKQVEKWRQWAARYDSNLDQMEWASKKSEEAIAKINEMRDKLVERAEKSVQRRRDYHVKRAVATLRKEAARKPEDDLSAAQWKEKADELEETLSWDAKPGKEYEVPRYRFVKLPLPPGVTYRIRENMEDAWTNEEGHKKEERVAYIVTDDPRWGISHCYLETNGGKVQPDVQMTRINGEVTVKGGDKMQYVFVAKTKPDWHWAEYKNKKYGVIRIKVELIRDEPRSRRRVR
jgi:hypothetical protein